MPYLRAPSRFHVRRGVLILILVCACALVVEWVVLTTFIFPTPRPFDSWSPYAKEYYDLAPISSASYEYVKTKAKEIAMSTDGIVNVVDVRESICMFWVEVQRPMPSQEYIDHAVANGLTLNFTVGPSPVDTMEKAYQKLLIEEYFWGIRDRVLELLTLDR